MSPSEKIRALLDERGIEYETVDSDAYYRTYWNLNGVRYRYTSWDDSQRGCLDICCANFITPEQAIAATVGPALDQDLRQALDFMRIWITDDAHLGESDISYELEKAEGLRNLEAIEQAIAATVGAGYAITFAPTLDRPPETMVGETVFDGEGNAIGWIVNATMGVGTCHIEERHGDWYCTGCGEMVGTCDPASELCIDGNAIELWRHRPLCGAKVVSR